MDFTGRLDVLEELLCMSEGRTQSRGLESSECFILMVSWMMDKGDSGDVSFFKLFFPLIPVVLKTGGTLDNGELGDFTLSRSELKSFPLSFDLISGSQGLISDLEPIGNEGFDFFCTSLSGFHQFFNELSSLFFSVVDLDLAFCILLSSNFILFVIDAIPDIALEEKKGDEDVEFDMVLGAVTLLLFEGFGVDTISVLLDNG